MMIFSDEVKQSIGYILILNYWLWRENQMITFCRNFNVNVYILDYYFYYYYPSIE